MLCFSTFQVSLQNNMKLNIFWSLTAVQNTYLYPDLNYFYLKKYLITSITLQYWYVRLLTYFCSLGSFEPLRLTIWLTGFIKADLWFLSSVWSGLQMLWNILMLCGILSVTRGSFPEILYLFNAVWWYIGTQVINIGSVSSSAFPVGIPVLLGMLS